MTFLMVFVIQGSQNRDTEMINAKLNEIIGARRAKGISRPRGFSARASSAD